MIDPVDGKREPYFSEKRRKCKVTSLAIGIIAVTGLLTSILIISGIHRAFTTPLFITAAVLAPISLLSSLALVYKACNLSGGQAIEGKDHITPLKEEKAVAHKGGGDGSSSEPRYHTYTREESASREDDSSNDTFHDYTPPTSDDERYDLQFTLNTASGKLDIVDCNHIPKPLVTFRNREASAVSGDVDDYCPNHPSQAKVADDANRYRISLAEELKSFREAEAPARDEDINALLETYGAKSGA